MQMGALKNRYYQDLKKGQVNPEVVKDNVLITYYTDLVGQTSTGLPKTEPTRGLGAADDAKNTAGAVSSRLLSQVKPQFCNIKNGVLSLVGQQLSLEECKALSNFLVNAIAPENATTVESIMAGERLKRNCIIRVLIIDDGAFTDEMFHHILQGVNK